MFYFLLNIILTVVWSLTSQNSRVNIVRKTEFMHQSVHHEFRALKFLKRIQNHYQNHKHEQMIYSGVIPMHSLSYRRHYLKEIKLFKVVWFCCFVTFNLEFFFIVLFVRTFFSSCKREKSTLHYQLQNMANKTACKIYFGENTI